MDYIGFVHLQLQLASYYSEKMPAASSSAADACEERLRRNLAGEESSTKSHTTFPVRYSAVAKAANDSFEERLRRKLETDEQNMAAHKQRCSNDVFEESLRQKLEKEDIQSRARSRSSNQTSKLSASMPLISMAPVGVRCEESSKDKIKRKMGKEAQSSPSRKPSRLSDRPTELTASMPPTCANNPSAAEKLEEKIKRKMEASLRKTTRCPPSNLSSSIPLPMGSITESELSFIGRQHQTQETQWQ